MADVQFLIILPGMATAGASARAEQLRLGLISLLESHGLDVTVSAGVAGLNIGDNADTLQHAVASALQGPRKGRQPGADLEHLVPHTAVRHRKEPGHVTETRLRTLTSVLAYGLSAAVFAMLALQNLRYGFYTLCYLAAGLSAISLGSCVYTLWVSRYQLRARGHLVALTLLHGVALTGAMSAPGNGIFWSLPILVLTYLVLPLRQALKVTLPVAVLVAMLVAWQLPASEPSCHRGAGNPGGQRRPRQLALRPYGPVGRGPGDYRSAYRSP